MSSQLFRTDFNHVINNNLPFISNSFLLAFDAISNSISASNFNFSPFLLYYFSKITLLDNSVEVPLRVTVYAIINSNLNLQATPVYNTGVIKLTISTFLYNEVKKEVVNLYLKPASSCLEDNEVQSQIDYDFLNDKLKNMNFRQILNTIKIFFKVSSKK